MFSRNTIALAAAVMISLPASAGDQLKPIGEFTSLINSGILTGMVAKEMCSCRFVVGLPMNECMKRSTLPAVLFNLILIVKEDNVAKSINAYPSPLYPFGPWSQATFNSAHPQKGCRIVYGAIEGWRDRDLSGQNGTLE